MDKVNIYPGMFYLEYISKVDPEIISFTVKGNASAQAGYTSTTTINASLTMAVEAEYAYLLVDIVNGTEKIINSGEVYEMFLSKSFNFIIQDTEGTHTIVLTVRSQGEVEVSREIILDTTAPEITMFSAKGASAMESGYTNSTKVNLSIAALDASLITYKVLSTDLIEYSTTKPTSANLSTTTEGSHTMILYVKDAAGNIVTKNSTISLDTIAPNVVSFTAGINGYLNASTLPEDEGLFPLLPFKLNMKDEDYYQYTVTAIDQINFIGGNMYESDITKFKEYNGNIELEKAIQGEYEVTLTIYDLAGNITIRTILIIRDTIYPVISKFTTSSAYTNSLSFGVSVKAADDNTLSYSISNTDLSAYSTTIPTFVTLSNKDDGEYTLTLSVKDIAGNIATKEITITIDTSIPEAVLENATACNSKSGFMCVTSGSQINASVKDNSIQDGNSNDYSYSLISPTQLSETELRNKLSEAINRKTNTHLPYTNSEKEYYVYGIYAPNVSSDAAGNKLTCTYSIDNYCIVEFAMSLTPSTKQNTLVFKDEIGLQDEAKGNNAYYKYIEYTTNPTILIELHTLSYSSSCSVPSLLSEYSDKMLFVNNDDNCNSHYLSNALVGYGNTYQFVNLVVINITPRIGGNNSGVNLTITAGEEISNFGVSFVSSDGEKLQTDTLITLNGVRVKEIDNNVPGVYSIRQSATDKNGKTAIVTSKITILEKENAKEELNFVELDTYLDVVPTPLPSHVAIEIETESEPKVEHNQEVKTVKQVEKIIENKSKLSFKNNTIRKNKKLKNKEKLMFKQSVQNINYNIIKNIHRINNLY